MKKFIWEIKIMGETSGQVGLFSSKRKALEALNCYSDNASAPYTIREDTEKMNKTNGPETIHLDYENGVSAFIFIHRICFNNGSSLTYLGRG